jgi:hypothetical protein
MRLNLALVARLTSIAIVAFLFGRARRPWLFPCHCIAYVAVMSYSAVLSAVMVSEFQLVVASVASVASRSPVGVVASIVVASIVIESIIVLSIVASPAEQTAPVVSSAFSHFATRVAIVEIVRVKKYSRVSLRSRSSRRSSFHCRQTAAFIAVSSRPAVASTIAVYALWLVVVSITPVTY